MKTPSGYSYNEDHDLDKCVICGIKMPNTDEPTCSVECEEERESLENQATDESEAVNTVKSRAESGDFIEIISVGTGDEYNVGDIFEVDLRFSSMGACDDNSLMTVEEHVVSDHQYVIHKSRYPSEDELRNQVLEKVEKLSFAQLKSLANHLML